MLDDKYILNLKIKDKNYKLTADMRFYKKLLVLTNRNPLNFIQDFINNPTDINISLLILAMSEDVKLKELNFALIDSSIEDKADICNSLINTIISELNSEVDEDKVKSEEHENLLILENEEVDEIKDFTDWWNYLYFIVTQKCNMSKSEFLEMTPRQIKSFDILNRHYERNILIDTYLKIHTPQSEEDKKQDIKRVKVGSILDL